MRPFLTYILLGVIFFSISNTVAAFDYVKLTHFSTDDGLNQSNVNSIIQDDDGYIWVSTMQGINRFDGYRITEVHSPDNILLSNYIDLLFLDSSGIIWIGAAPNHNYQLDKTTNQLTEISLSAPKNYKLEYETFTHAAEDKAGNIWFSTYNEIYFYHREKKTFEFILSSVSLLNDPDKKEIFRDLLIVDKQLFMATSKGLFELNVDTRQANLIQHTNSKTPNTEQNNVKSLLDNHNGTIMIGTVEGLYEFPTNSSSQSTESKIGKVILEDYNIWSIIQKPDFYWLATDKGLFKLTKSGHLEFIFKYSDTPFDTSDDDITTMIEDREGNLWFGSRSDGLFKWRPNFGD